MFGQARLNKLRARKQLLLFEGRVERELLMLETQNVAHALRWLEPVQRGWQQVRPFAWLAAPVAGFCLARRGGSIWRWGLRIIEIGRRLVQLAKG